MKTGTLRIWLFSAGLAIALLAFGDPAAGAVCGVQSAKVKSVFQWDDGHIFVVFDRSTSCACAVPDRLGFHKNDNEKMFMALALTALSTGQFVWAYGDDATCPVHGNTVRMFRFGLVGS